MEKKKSTICGIVVGVFLLVAGIIILSVIPYIFKKSLEIRPGSLQYENWYEPEVPVYMQWYLFNLTNAANVSAKKEKPRFQQLGPYTYREERIKSNITWNDNGTVTYQNLRNWFFVPDMSSGSENDTIVSVNLPLVVVAEAFRYESGAVKTGLSFLLSLYNETLFKSYTMYELIWGYHDPMMAAAKKLIPDWFYTDFLGIYAGKNNTNDGTWEVDTGEYNIAAVGETRNYNGSKFLNFWSTQWANMVNGTDGTIAKPGVSKNDTIYFFSPDVCRSLYAKYIAMENTTEGIDLYRFSSPLMELEEPFINPDNAGFCTPAGNCRLSSGFMNLSTCQTLDRFHIPVVASLPHFLYGDLNYLEAVEGLSPNEQEHRTDVAVEPLTGIVMRVAKRLQINMYLEPVPFISQLQNIEEIVFPITWLNESAIIDKRNQDKFLSLMLLMNAGKYGGYALIGVGALILLFVAGRAVVNFLKKNYSIQKYSDLSAGSDELS